MNARKSDQPHRPNHPDASPDIGKLNSVKAVAVYFAVSEKTIRRIIASGQLEICRIGGSIRITDREVEAYQHRSRSVSRVSVYDPGSLK